MDGIIVINKPAGYTSHDCIAILRGILGQKKIGHTGTLDPNATGVLPVCFGNATKLIEYMDSASKTYVAGIKFGMVSDTQDIWGSELENPFKDAADKLSELSENDIINALKKFKGEIEQTPPAYSAVFVDGRRAYDIARSGEKPNLKSRRITIYSIKLLDFNMDTHEGRIEVCCSRGTYIRTICNDLGEMLGCGAVLSSLVRTKACGFAIEDALDLEKARSMKAEDVLSGAYSIDYAIRHLPKLVLDDKEAKFYLNGMTLKKDPSGYEQNAPIAVFGKGELIGISQFVKDSLKPIKVFS